MDTTTPTAPVITRPDAQVPTYAETQGQPPFDWNAFLAAEKHTDAEWTEAEKLSFKWVTCACGNQCASIPRFTNDALAPRSGDGAPMDITLRGYGTQFYHDIVQRNSTAACHTLAAIERRSSELLAEMAAKS